MRPLCASYFVPKINSNLSGKEKSSCTFGSIRKNKSLQTIDRASDNSREKNSNFAGFAETNSRRKRPISREFRVNFGSKFRRKAKKKEPRKKYIGRMSNSGQERKHKSSFNTVLKATVLVSSDKKNISLSFTETPGRLTSFFSCSLEPNKATQ